MRRTALLIVMAVALPALDAATAQAGCGGVQRRDALRDIATGRAPLIIGDSVLLGGMPEVARAGFEINAKGCRGWEEGLDVMRARRRSHTLPALVVLQLGTNYGITVSRVRAAMEIAGNDRIVAVMTPREVGGGEGDDAIAVRRAAQRWPGRVVALDWVRHTRPRGGWFQPDGIHLTASGARGFARFLLRARPFADGPPLRAERTAGHESNVPGA